MAPEAARSTAIAPATEARAAKRRKLPPRQLSAEDGCDGSAYESLHACSLWGHGPKRQPHLGYCRADAVPLVDCDSALCVDRGELYRSANAERAGAVSEDGVPLVQFRLRRDRDRISRGVHHFSICGRAAAGPGGHETGLILGGDLVFGGGDG